MSQNIERMTYDRNASTTRLTFARNFKAAREACHTSQVEIALRTGIHRTVVSEIERGKHNPTVDLVHRLSEIVGRTVKDLLTVPEKP